MTAQPHAHVRFRRAIKRRALWVAEDAARELPNLSLQDAPAGASAEPDLDLTRQLAGFHIPFPMRLERQRDLLHR